MYYSPAQLLCRIEADVRDDFQHQVLDQSRPDFGAVIFPQYGIACADHTSGGLALFRMCIALLADGSSLRGDPALFRRIQAALTFTRRWQRPTGLIDLPKVDFDSPPDTAFLVQALCPVLELARRRGLEGDDQARAIEASLTGIIASASAGIVGRGFRTPNHRWVVCSALAQAMSLIPELHARAYVEQVLAETIDINRDGEYSERSTGVYSAVCNRSLRFIARHLDKPELLDHVRANLDFMESLIDPADGTVITSISTRQDHGKAVVPITMADSYFALGMTDANARWLATAEVLAKHGIGQNDAGFALPWLFEPFMREARYPTRFVEVTTPPPPTRFYPVSRMWRLCRDDVSAFAAAGNENAFSMKFGDISVAAVRVRGTYFHAAHFAADTIEPIEGGVRLVHLASRRPNPGWDLPLNRPVVFDNPHKGFYPLADGGTRDRWLLPPMDIVLDVNEVDGGFDLTLTTRGGCDRVPMAVEVFVRAGSDLECAGLSFRPVAGQIVRLRDRRVVYHTRQHALEIGCGEDAHRLADDTLSQQIPGCFRLVIAMQTPVKSRTIQLRHGRWSDAERRLLSSSNSLETPSDPSQGDGPIVKSTQPIPWASRNTVELVGDRSA